MEYNFRGKRIDNGEWVYGKLLKLATPEEYFIMPIGGEASPALFYDSYEETGKYIVEAVKVIPETVGQFTGLKDKNGKEIYEGDILLDKWIVTFEDGCFWTECYKNSVPKMLLRDLLRPGIYNIIGNIYDNPELLEMPNAN